MAQECGQKKALEMCKLWEKNRSWTKHRLFSCKQATSMPRPKREARISVTLPGHRLPLLALVGVVIPIAGCWILPVGVFISLPETQNNTLSLRKKRHLCGFWTTSQVRLVPQTGPLEAERVMEIQPGPLLSSRARSCSRIMPGRSSRRFGSFPTLIYEKAVHCSFRRCPISTQRCGLVTGINFHSPFRTGPPKAPSPPSFGAAMSTTWLSRSHPCARAQPNPDPSHPHTRTLHNSHSSLPFPGEHRTASALNPEHSPQHSPRAITQADQPTFARALEALGTGSIL